MLSLHRTILIMLFAYLAFEANATADFVSFNDFDDWQDAAGPFHTVTFEEFPVGTIVRDHYADLGVEFVGPADDLIGTGGILDDFLLQSLDTDIFIEFTVPQFEFGAHYLGSLVIEVFSEGEPIFIDNFATLDVGFAGLVSDQPFDSIRLSRLAEPSAFVDNIYFTIPAPGALALLGLGALIGVRRRGRA